MNFIVKSLIDMVGAWHKIIWYWQKYQNNINFFDIFVNVFEILIKFLIFLPILNNFMLCAHYVNSDITMKFI